MTKKTRERVRDLEDTVIRLEDELEGITDSLENLRSATSEILRALDKMSVGTESHTEQRSQPTNHVQQDLENAIGDFASMLKGGGGGLGSLLQGFLGSQVGSMNADSKDLVDGYRGQTGKLTSTVVKLSDSMQTIASTAQNILPLIVMVDKFQESDMFKKLSSQLGKLSQGKAKQTDTEPEEVEEVEPQRPRMRRPMYRRVELSPQ